MDDLQQEITKWLHTQQAWIQEAALKLLQNNKLSEDDFIELVDLLKTPEGQEKTSTRQFPIINGAGAAINNVRIESIGSIRGIDNLSPKSPLSFGKGNLTVIYGNNGTGKSGYTRILKKACGKAQAADLKSNVFIDQPVIKDCTITYNLNGLSTSRNWIANSPPIEDLIATDIFDSNASLVYLGGERPAAYTPPAIAFFESLVSTLKLIKSRLQTEQDNLASQKPKLPPEHINTKAGQSYTLLTATQKEIELSHILIWNDEDKVALTQKNERLTQADPVAQAKIKRTQNQQITSLAQALKNGIAAVSPKNCNIYYQLRNDAKQKRQTATEGAIATTGLTKFDGVGDITWRALWQAAKDYSLKFAYPLQDFPVTSVNSRCPLCHQELDVEAKQRLKDFETYVQGVLEKNAVAAEAALKLAIDSIPIVPTDEELQTKCQAAGVAEGTWLELIQKAWQEMATLFTEIKDEKLTNICAGLNAGKITVTTLLDTKAIELEAEAAQYDEDALAFDKIAITKEISELKAKEWTAQQAEAIRFELKRLKDFQQYETFKRYTNTTATSKKSGEISEKIITDAYIKRFNIELLKLKAKNLKDELVKTRTDSGRPLHQIQLKGLVIAGTTPNQILSDGEHRIVSLAAFLADVTGKNARTPFIFDDPISSLDQDYEWNVSTRLIELANDRQVLIFTHRLSLYSAIEDAAKKEGDAWKKAHLNQLCIELFNGTTGHPVSPEAWNSATKESNNILIGRLDAAKKMADAGDIPGYKIHAQSICTDFRKLLERTVENDLLNDIVKRHRRSVTTDNRIGHLSKITHGDCEYIDDLMTKYSCYEHSQSQEAAPAFIPEEAELRADLIGLKTWRGEFKERAA